MNLLLKKKQSGVTLIEVLISVVILSVGILGLTALQLSAKRAGFESVQRSMATALVRDITERMRMNAGQITGYVIDDLTVTTAGTEPTPNCKTADCTPAQLAAHDVWEWAQALGGASEQVGGASAGGLVSPRACITHAAGIVNVAIAWQGFEDLGSPTSALTGSDCGAGAGLYVGADGTDDKRRQLLLVTTFIQDI